MIQQKLLYTKQDEMSIVVVGTQEASNPLYEEAEGEGYGNITVLSPMGLPKLNLLEKVEQIECEDCTSGDIIDGLTVGMAIIDARVQKLKFSKRYIGGCQ